MVVVTVPLVDAIVLEMDTVLVLVCVTVGVDFVTVVDGVDVTLAVTVFVLLVVMVVVTGLATEVDPYLVVHIWDEVVLT